MAAQNFSACVKRLLAHEGGYGNHPSDPGGPTNFGITIHDYRKHVSPNGTATDLRAMPVDVAKTIYRTKYWDALRCDELASGLDYAAFDYGVNSGTARAAKVLQRIVGRASVHDRIDAETLALLRARDPKALIAAVCDERAAFLRRLKTWPVFGVGWGRRVADVRAVSLAMAAKQDAFPPASRANGKAVVPINTKAQKGTTGSALAAGTAAAGQAAQSGARPFVILAIVVGTIALAFAAWAFWRWRQRRQQIAAV